MERHSDGYQEGYDQAQFEQSLGGLPYNGIGPGKGMLLGCGFINLVIVLLGLVVIPINMLMHSKKAGEFARTLIPTVGMSGLGVVLLIGAVIAYRNYLRKMARLYGTSAAADRERARYARERPKK